MFDGLQILSNTTKNDQTHKNTIKKHQTRCPNGKMFGHQTIVVSDRQTFIVCPSPNVFTSAGGCKQAGS